MTGAAAALHVVVHRYYERVDAHDVAGILELFSADAVYRRPGYDPLVGHAALDDFYRHRRVIASGSHAVTNVVCGVDRAAVEGRFEGTLNDGSKTALEFADFYRFTGSLVIERTTYFYAPLV